MLHDDESQTASNLWPLSKFSFRVEWGGATLSCQEVSGLDAETKPIEYRSGDSRLLGAAAMPGLKKTCEITLKKCQVSATGNSRDWLDGIKEAAGMATITLLDEGGGAMMVWTLTNARLTKLSSADLKAGGNEIALETLALSGDSLTTSEA